MAAFSSRLRLLLLSLLVVPLLLTGCGSNSSSRPSATPAENAPIFVSGNFGKIPIHPLAKELGPRAVKDGVTAQSFEARNLSKDQLFSWYAEHLAGWTQTTAPASIGEATGAAWRATWTRKDKQLIVTASDAPTLSGDTAGGDPVIQFSLSLEPLGT